MEKTPDQLTAVDKEPISYTFAKYMQKMRIRGGYRLEHFLRDSGSLDFCVRYNLPNNVKIDIPIGERSYNLNDLIHYESDSVEQLAPILSNYGTNFCLLDCGADIGLMSAKFVSANPSINRVIAFEPNHISYKYLERNMSLLRVNSEAINMGVSDYSGTAELRVPDFDSHDHAAYVVPKDDGDIQVISIDDLEIEDSSGMFLKVDVEGAELSVIRGAKNTIAKAQHAVILFEAHRQQVERTGVGPDEIIRYINSIKACDSVVMEEPNKKINLNKSFFSQFPNNIYNICVYSK